MNSPVDHVLTFIDGPAHIERVHTLIAPEVGTKRWYCRAVRGDTDPTTWWVIDAEPPADDTLEVTPYVCTGHKPTGTEPGEIIWEFRVAT